LRWVWIYQQTQQQRLCIDDFIQPTALAADTLRVAGRPLEPALAVIYLFGNALVTLSVVLLLAFGDLQIWHIYIIVVIGSAFSAFQEPAYLASISMLVPKDNFTRASGMISLASAMDGLAAPLLAVLLFVQIGLPGILLIDVVTYFAVGLAHRANPSHPRRQPVKRVQGLGDLQFGWNYLHGRFVGLLLILHWSILHSISQPY
jgi:MFS family permease